MNNATSSELIAGRVEEKSLANVAGLFFTKNLNRGQRNDIQKAQIALLEKQKEL
ncbi:hypothetical protein [Photobacterium leiognathi]|uniref:hypothetical protein n=1 Tax=Photobacterium leiognathi TaxID=553611 RepID=UPI0029819D43|nr:hypothetical protein [Photobacterium leiognathi]